MKKKRVLITIAIFTVFSLAACSSAAPMPSPMQSAPAPASAPSSVMDVALEADFASAMESPALSMRRGDGTQAESEYLALPILTPSQADSRRLIYSVSMSLQTMEFLQGKRRLLNTVAEAGGYVLTAHVQGYDLNELPTERNAWFSFRIPTERLPEFIIFAENNYNIWHLWQEMQDVTIQYQRTAWNLDDLREQESLLLERLERARGEEFTELSNALSEVRRTIREREASQTLTMDAVMYSTLDIQLFEVFERELIEEESRNREFVNLIMVGLVLVIILMIGVMASGKKHSEKALESNDSDAKKCDD